MWYHLHGLPWWLSGKESTCNAGAAGGLSLVPGSGSSPGEENGNPPQYCCLRNSMDGGAWKATDYGVAKTSWRWLSDLTTMTKIKQVESRIWHEWTYLWNRVTVVGNRLEVSQGEGGWRRDGAGAWGPQMQSIVNRMDEHQGPTVEHGELCSVSYDKP